MYTFCYVTVKLWKMLENKYKDNDGFKVFLKSQFTYGKVQDVSVLTVYNVLYIRSSH